MPLSEREQQILQEIEKNLSKEDPSFARGVGRSGFEASRRFKLGILAFVAGLVALLAFFLSQALWLGVLAFGGMVSGIVLIAGSFRGFSQGGDPSSKERFAHSLSRWEERIRRRYRRDR